MCVVDLAQVVDILDKGEACAHREADDAGVDQEADAVGAEQVNQDRSLDALFNQGRQVSRVEGVFHAGKAEHRRVQPGTGHRRGATGQEHLDQEMRAEQAVTVQAVQDNDEDQDRRQCYYYF